jgi:antitoxin MazE
MNTLRTPLIKIGNSRGIRIPRLLISQIGFEKEVEITVQPGALVIRPIGRSRQGWEEHFRSMSEHGDDRMFDGLVSTQWDEKDWEW